MMKKNLVPVFIFLLFANLSLAQSVGINDDGSNPDPSAILDIKSTNKGLLVPRMSTAEREAIPAPAEGLKVFDTITKTFWYYNGIGWIEIIPGAGGFSPWSINGTNIYNNNSGYVGIGLSNPLTSLHILKDQEAMIIQGTTSYINFKDAAGVNRGFVWQGPGDNMSIGTSLGNSTGSFQVYNNNTLNMNLTSGGVMDLVGTIPWMRFYDGATRSGDLYGENTNFEIAAFKSGVPASAGHLILQTNDAGFGGTIYAGNIGIGTRTPTYKLQVERDGWGIVQSNGSLRAGFYVSGGGGWLATQSMSPLYFCTGLLNGNNVAQMMIATNGNVGIGTLSPSHKLAVNGTIRSKEVIVETGWADYVFDKGYRLMPLPEVEQFIREHRHLPNIPSAKEIETNGLAVGDVQRRMMEKIEELTLYVIELRKEIDRLKTTGTK
jgi:hypothetical protein